ncbi:hypothetical protein MMC07_002555 [Pseudocyphellaria aurata]|nr:hypothetical protein [Pseudocyphellaria aurata]
MSFGFSVGDFAALGQLAWRIYKACKDAPESFKNISQEVSSLHLVLKEVEETLSNSALSVPQQSRLESVGDGCRVVLQDLQFSLDKYNSLGTKSKRTWDRLGWGSRDIAELRSRLISNTVMLTTLVNTSQINVQRKLDMFKQEYQDGRHEGSMVSTQTIESLSVDEKQAWRAIRKELEDIGISIEAFDANKDFILNWFKTAISTGAFEEQILEVETSSMSDNDDLSQSWEDSRLDPLVRQHLEDPETGTDLLSPAIKRQAWKLSSEAKGQRRRPPRIAGLINWLFRDNTKFRKAVQSGDETKVRELLKDGVDINMRDEHGMTPLHHAVCSNSVEDRRVSMARLLLDNGAEINSKDAGGITELHLAARSGDEKVVELLLMHEAKIEAKDNNGFTALHWAVRDRQRTMVQLLLHHGAKIKEKTNEDERTALHQAARSGDEKVMKLLLNHEVKIDEIDDSGYTALHWAVRYGQVTVAQLLLDNGAEINSKDIYDGSTELHLAAKFGDEEVVKLLLMRGAKTEEKDDNGYTALHWAVRAGQVTVVQLLLHHGAKIKEKTNEDERTALHQAARSGDEKVMKLLLNHEVKIDEIDDMAQLLLENGADVNSKDMDGSTELHLAAGHGDEEVVKLLLMRGARIEEKDDNGCTALHCAVKAGQVTVMQLLLENGATVVGKDCDGTTLLHHAVSFDHESKALLMSQLLLQHGANPNEIADHSEMTALHWAVGSGREEIVQNLLDNGAEIDKSDMLGETALIMAANRGYTKLMEILLERGPQIGFAM